MPGLFRKPPQPWQRPRWTQPPDPVQVCWHDTVVALSPISYWRLGEPSGTSATDEQGANTGTYVNTPTLGATSLLSGDSNTAVTFVNASAEYMVAKTAKILGSLTTASFVCRLNTTSFNIQAIYVERSGTLATTLLKFGINGTDHLEFTYRPDGGSSYDSFASSATVINNGEHTIGFTVSGTTVVLYIDGAADGGGTLTTSDKTMAGAGIESWLGADKFDGAGVNGMDGTLDEVALFSTTLSAGDMAAIHSSRTVACAAGSKTASATDAFTMADSLARTFVGFRTATDTATRSDVATRTGTYIRAVTDAITRSDVATRVVSAVRAATDAVARSDAATRAVTLVRAATDAVTQSDAATRLGTFLRAATDSVTWSDVATQSKTFIRTATDAVSFSDAVTRTGTFLRTATDSVTRSDAATRVLTLLRSAADAVTWSDAATRVLTLFRTITDSATWSDVATFIKTGAGNYFHTATDAISFSDAATRTGTFVRTVTDAIARSDAATRALTLFRTVTDATAWSDTATRVKGVVRDVTDAVTRSDVATRIAVLYRTGTDAVTWADVAAAAGGSLTTIGGFPPIAYAANFISRAFGRSARPDASASNPTPDGDASNPKPR